MCTYKDIDIFLKELNDLSEEIYDKKTIKKCIRIINKIPEENVKKEIIGQWIKKTSPYISGNVYACSICDEYYIKHPYCPHCGAKMEIEEK